MCGNVLRFKNVNMKSLKKFLVERPFYRHIVVLITGNATAQALVAIGSPVIARLYSPKEFGLLTVYVSILSVWALLGSLQYENAIPIPEDDDSGANLLALSFAILVLVCLTGGIALWAVRDRLLILLNAPELTAYLWLLPVSLLGVGTFNILYRWNQRRHAFGRIAETKITQTAGMICTQIGLGLFRNDPLGLLLGDIFGRMGGSGRMAYLLLREDRGILRFVTVSGIRRVAARFKKFPLLSGGSALLKELSDQLPAVMLIIVYGPQVVGWFILVQRVLGLPLALVGYSWGNVYMSEALSLLPEDTGEKKLLALYWQTLKHLLLFVLPFLTVLFFVAPQLFPFIFGPAWHQAGLYLRILCPMYLLQFLSLPVAPTVYVLQRQDLQLFREAVRIGLLLLTLGIVVKGHLAPMQALSLITISGSAAFMVNGLMSWLAIKQKGKAEPVAG